MQVRLLGHIEVVPGAGEATPLDLGGPTMRRILALLALRRNEVVSVQRLTEVVWPSGDLPGRADHNVRTYVHRLRSALDGHSDRLETAGAGYRLALDTAELDAAEFDRLVGAVGRLATMGDPSAALDLIDRAERLWRGDPLSEFESELWAMPHVVRLRHLRSELSILKASALVEAGRQSSAVGILEELVQNEPLQERPRSLLMRALHQSGRQVEALRTFQDFRQVLIEQTGLEPSAELADLDRAILMNDLPTTVDPAPKIAGYRLHERIGTGEFTTVYMATQAVLERRVAIKVINSELANRPEFIRRFETGARMVARIEHPNVVPLYDYWREPDQAFLVMRWMDGGTLLSRLDAGPWSLAATVELIDQMASALDASHRGGVVHGDVSPGNILFDADGRPYLGDFDVALLGSRRPPTAGHTEPPRPEIDVYGLAAVAFTLLAGHRPFAEESGGRLPSIREHRPDVPAAVDEVLGIASAADPNERYPVATAMSAALRAACVASEAVPTIVARPRANPYKGLQPFDETDSADFHGRDRLVDELVAHLESSKMLAVVGPSGSGKSSVVRAGLLPALRAGRIRGSERWFVTTMTPGSRPYEALEAALLRVAVDPPATLLAQLQDGERGIARSIRRILPVDAAAVLVIDQFEEVFGRAVDEEEADLFLRALVAVAQDADADVRLVLTLRADFYDRPLRHPVFAPFLKRGSVAVTPLAPDELEQAVIAPAAALGVDFEAGLVAEIIAEVNQEPGALPLLQYALTRAFDATEADAVTRAAYKQVGRIGGAVAQEAEAMWGAADEAERVVTRRLFLRLVALGEGTEDTRRRVSVVELGDESQRVIERFGQARLLTLNRDPVTGLPTVELAHEAIIRQWPRLRAWLDEDRDDVRAQRHLTAATAAWREQNFDPAELYRGSRLAAAESLAESSAVALNTAESAFLRASLEERARQEASDRNRLRRLRRLVAATALVAVVALVAGLAAAVQGRRAQVASREAETGRLIATAQSLVESKPRAAVLLALAAFQRQPGPRTIGALQTALSRTGPELQYLGWGSDYLDVEWLDDDSVVGIRADGVDLFDLSTGEVADTIELVVGTGAGRAGAVTRDLDRAPARASSGGGLLAVAAEQDVVVYTVDQGLRQRFRVRLPGLATGVDVSPDGRFVVGTAADGTVGAWSEEGEALFPTHGLDLAADLTEQWAGTTDLTPLFPDWFDVDPLWVRPMAHEDHFHLAAGARTLTIGYDGEQVAEPVTTYLSLAAAVPQQVVDVIHRGDESVLVATSSVGRHSGGDVVRLNLIDGTFGSTGLPMAGVFVTGDGALRAVLEDGSVVGLDAATAESTPILRLRVDPVRAASVDAGGHRLAVATAEGVVVADLDGGGPLVTTLPRDETQASVSISEDGRFVVVGPNGLGTTAAIHTLDRDAKSGGEGPLLGRRDYGLVPSHVVPATNVSLRPPNSLWVSRLDGLRLSEYFVTLYRLDGESLVVVGDGPRTVGVMQDLDPSGRFVAVGEAFDDRVALVDPIGLRDVGELALPPDIDIAYHLGGIRFDADGSRLLVSSRFGSADLWDTATWEQVDSPDLSEYDIASAYWNEDGSLVATAASDGQLTVRDGLTFEPVQRLIGAARPVGPYRSGPMVFSRDARFLLTNHDNVIRLWDLDTGQQVGTDIPTAEGTVSGINGGAVFHAVTAEEGRALIWNLDMDTWPDLACVVAGSNLTPAEWEQWGPADEDHRAICSQFPLAS